MIHFWQGFALGIGVGAVGLVLLLNIFKDSLDRAFIAFTKKCGR